MRNPNVAEFRHNCSNCVFLGYYEGLGDFHVCVSTHHPLGVLKLRTGDGDHDYECATLPQLKLWETSRPRVSNQFTMGLARYRDTIRKIFSYKGLEIRLRWTPRGAGLISREEALIRWPRLTAHLICTSLGYAMPLVAAAIIADYFNGSENWCEWIYSCYDRKPGPAVQQAFRGRRSHKGYMAHYPNARLLVAKQIQDPNWGYGRLAAWF